MKKFDEKSAESHAFEEQAVDVGYKWICNQICQILCKNYLQGLLCTA